jgi:hypothetical protein
MGMNTSINCTENKIPIMELNEALSLLGERGRKGLMDYIQVHNPNASEGYIELEMVDEVLQKVFGEASELLMKQILHQ